MKDTTALNAAELAATTSDPEETKGALHPVEETFYLEDGTYTGIISNAFLYKEGHVMIKIELEENKAFLLATSIEKLERYPYSQLLIQANVRNVKDLENLKVQFVIQNNSKNGEIFSNVKKIYLAN